MNEKRNNPGRLVLPSLVLSRFATMPPTILTGLLLIDIGQTFGLTVGVAGQIRTAAAITGVATALLLGALSVRYKARTLLISGLALLVIFVAGCTFAPSFETLMILFSMTGLAGAVVGPMGFTIVADNFPPEDRANAIGWIIAGMSASNLIGAPIIGYISGFVGWRGAFLFFVLPVSVAGLLFSLKYLPRAPPNPRVAEARVSLMEGFRGVLSNTSAIACLTGTALTLAAYQAMVLYAPSFYRERFLLSTRAASLMVIGSSIFFIAGTRLSSRLITRFGKKPLITFPTLMAGMFIMIYSNLPNLWMSVAARFLGSIFTGVMATAMSALTLEQVPRFRGTVMSLNQAAYNLGGALGAGVGGLVILSSGYGGLGFSHGVMMLAAMALFHFLAVDPSERK